SWNVRATHPHHPLEDQALEPGRPDQVIRLRTGTSVIGTVLTHRGLPAADARVQVRLGRGSAGRTRTEEDGSFAARGLAPGAGHLVVHAVGEQVYHRPIEVGAGETLRADVQLAGPLRIGGRVLDED